MNNLGGIFVSAQCWPTADRETLNVSPPPQSKNEPDQMYFKNIWLQVILLTDQTEPLVKIWGQEIKSANCISITKLPLGGRKWLPGL